MKRDLRKRLADVESRESRDWSRRVNTSGYYLGNDCGDDWVPIYEDNTGLVVLRNKETGELRGTFVDRRSTDEMIRAGGDPAYL